MYDETTVYSKYGLSNLAGEAIKQGIKASTSKAVSHQRYREAANTFLYGRNNLEAFLMLWGMSPEMASTIRQWARNPKKYKEILRDK